MQKIIISERLLRETIALKLSTIRYSPDHDLTALTIAIVDEVLGAATVENDVNQ